MCVQQFGQEVVVSQVNNIKDVYSRRWIATLTLYITRKGRFDCHGGSILHSYLIVLLGLLGIIILTLCAVVYISAQGKPLFIID